MLAQSEASGQRLDALGFGVVTTDMVGKGGIGSPESGGLDSLSEYTLPGEWCEDGLVLEVLFLLVSDSTQRHLLTLHGKLFL